MEGDFLLLQYFRDLRHYPVYSRVRGPPAAARHGTRMMFYPHVLQVLADLHPPLANATFKPVSEIVKTGTTMALDSTARHRPTSPTHMPQRNAAVCTGASHSASISVSTAETVIEQPAISSDVTYDPVR